VEREGATDRPEHDDERCRRQHRRGRSDREVDRRLGRDAHVVGDAAFGVLVGAAGEIELVVAAVSEPAIEQEVVEPRAPSPLHRHARADQHDAEEDAACQKRHIQHGQQQHRVRILGLQRVEDDAMPDVHAVGCAEVQQDDEENRRGQEPGEARPARPPEAARALPEAPQQTAPCEAARIVAGPLQGEC
jgi:hypothetical protein